MPRIIMNRAFIARWTRMRHFTGPLSASASSHHSLSSAAFITNIAESDFRHAHRLALASHGFCRLLAMEVSFARWPTADRPRGARPDPTNEPREPTVGRHQDPWRVAQARHRGRPIHSFDLHGAAVRSATADLEDLCSQSYGGDCVD